MAQAVDADHQARLDLGGAFQKPLVVAGQGHPGRNEQERVHRNQHAKELILILCHQHVLQRREHKEHPEQRAMIAQPRGRERDELAQRPKRNQPEQDHGGRAATDCPAETPRPARVHISHQARMRQLNVCDNGRVQPDVGLGA